MEDWKAMYRSIVMCSDGTSRDYDPETDADLPRFDPSKSDPIVTIYDLGDGPVVIGSLRKESK